MTEIAIPHSLDVAVACPYCKVGSGRITVTKAGGEERVEGLQEPIRCLACQRYFKVRLQVLFKGEPIPGEPLYVKPGQIVLGLTGLT